MLEKLTFAGVCSGVGGFDLAAVNAGLAILWGCEIDPSCRSVLANRFPGVLVFQDMMADDLLAAPSPDIFAGGTPCQGFSIAGLRKGLNDDRSNLALRFLQLCNHHNPRVILWENVPGVLSDKENAFGCFMAGLVGADAPLVPTSQSGGRWTNAGLVAGPKRTAAWRVLDSQYLAVAQRRERVFVVASPRAELPFQILFEPEGMRRHSAPSREAGKTVAGTLGGSSQSGGFRTTDLDQTGAFIAFGGNNQGGAIDVATALRAKGGTGHGDFESETFIATGQGYWSESEKSAALATQARSVYESTLVCPTLRAGGNSTGGDRPPGTDVDTCESLVPVAVSFRTNAAGQVDPQGDRVAALTSATDPCSHFIAFKPCFVSETARRPSGNPSDLVPALTSNTKGGDTAPCVAMSYAVRRLTPRETERLQAFPDDWTAVTNQRGKPMADGPRYKMMGNAITVSVGYWILDRIKKSLNHQ